MAIPIISATSAAARPGLRRVTISLPDPTGRARCPPASRKSIHQRHLSRSFYFALNSLTPRICQASRKCKQATKCSLYLRFSNSRHHPPHRKSTLFPRRPQESKPTSSSISPRHLSSCHLHRKPRISALGSPVLVLG